MNLKRLFRSVPVILSAFSRNSRSLDRRLSLSGRSSLRVKRARLLTLNKRQINRPYFHRGFIVGTSVILLLLPLYVVGVLECFVNSDCTILRFVTSVGFEGIQ